MTEVADRLQPLTVPVNSAAYWTSLYVVDDEPELVIDLVAVRSAAEERCLARPLPIA